MNQTSKNRRDMLRLGAGTVVGIMGMLGSADVASASENISYGDRISGELTNNDPEDSIYGHYDEYTFQAEGGDAVHVEMRGENREENLCGLRLLNPDGERVYSAGRSSGAGRNALIDEYDIPQREAGEYTIIAHGQHDNEDWNFFTYELLLYEGTPIDQEIEYGAQLEGELTRDDLYDRQNGYFDAYNFEAEGGDAVHVEMRGENWEENLCGLELYNPEGERVYSTGRPNDEGGNALIDEYDIPQREAGEYTIIAHGQHDNEDWNLFAYELLLYKGTPIDREIEYGAQLEGELTRDDLYDRQNGYFDAYSFEARGGDQLTIQLSPANADEDTSQLLMYDSEGTRAYSAPAGRDDGTAIIENYNIDERSEGEYTVVVTGGFLGTYSLELILEESEEHGEPNFGVSEVDTVDVNLNQRDTIQVSGMITNTGDTGGTQTVELQLDGEVIDSQDVSLDCCNSSASIEFSMTNTSGLDGDYEYSISSNNDSQSAEMTVIAPDSSGDDETDGSTGSGEAESSGDMDESDESGQPSDSSETDGSTGSGETEGSEDTGDSDDSLSGFGIMSALSAIGGAGYLINRRLGRD